MCQVETRFALQVLRHNLYIISYRVILDHPALNITPHIALVVHVQPVIVETEQDLWRLHLQVLDILPQVSPALPHPPGHGVRVMSGSCASLALPGHVLCHLDMASSQQGCLPQHFLPVFKLLKSHQNWPGTNP